MVSLAIAISAWFALSATTGILFTVLGLVFVAAALVFLREVARRLLGHRFGPRVRAWSINGILLACSLGSCVVLAEVAIGLVGSARTDEIDIAEAPEWLGGEDLNRLPADVRSRVIARHRPLVMPAEWDKLDTEVPGARRAFYWQGALHVLDANRMRRSEPFPPRDPRTFRILVFGDSFTYGAGIEEQWTYPRQLERMLGEGYRVEVLNLGVSGHQSEDVLNKVRGLYDDLAPDLVIYGICLNDFLESDQEVYDGSLLKLPTMATRRSKALAGFEDLVNTAGRAFGWSRHFYTDVLEGARNYQARFARDLEEMNGFVRGRGGHPVVAMTLDHAPRIGGIGQEVAGLAERAARDAGMTVIPSDPYYDRYDGIRFAVSPWEGHPNELANLIFAERLKEAVEGCCGMAAFARSTADGLERQTTQ